MAVSHHRLVFKLQLRIFYVMQPVICISSEFQRLLLLNGEIVLPHGVTVRVTINVYRKISTQ